MVPRRDRSLKDFRQRARRQVQSPADAQVVRGDVVKEAHRPELKRHLNHVSAETRVIVFVQWNIPGSKIRHVLIKLGLSSPRPDCSVRHSHRCSRPLFQDVHDFPEELGRVRGPRPVHFDRRRGCGRGDRRGGDRARRAEEAREEEKDATRYRRRRLPRRRHRHRHCLKSAVSHPTSSHPEKSQTERRFKRERESRSLVRSF